MSQLTKRAIEEAFKTLLRSKSFEKITVSDIADACGINRMTFYYHFKDIYDLMEWCLIEDAAKALGGKKTYDTWQQGFLQIFNRALENKQLIMNIYNCVSHDLVENYLYKLCYDLLIGVVEEQSANIQVTEQEKQFIANFYKFAFVGFMLDWIKKGMHDDPKAMIDQLSIVIKGDFVKAMKEFESLRHPHHITSTQ